MAIDSILPLIQKELLKDGYTLQEVLDSLSKANISINDKLVAVTYDNGMVDEWDIIIIPKLIFRNK